MCSDVFGPMAGAGTGDLQVGLGRRDALCPLAPAHNKCSQMLLVVAMQVRFLRVVLSFEESSLRTKVGRKR